MEFPLQITALKVLHLPIREVRIKKHVTFVMVLANVGLAMATANIITRWPEMSRFVRIAPTDYVVIVMVLERNKVYSIKLYSKYLWELCRNNCVYDTASFYISHPPMTQTQTTYFPQLLSEFFTTSRELQAGSCPLLFMLSSFQNWGASLFRKTTT